MNVLLIGEFSGLHNELKSGLAHVGESVVVWANGDGWKTINSDLHFYPLANKNRIVRLLSILLQSVKFKQFDIIQFISPAQFSTKFGFNRLIYRILIRKAKRLFLVGAGAENVNSVIYDYFLLTHKYIDFHDIITENRLLWSNTLQGRKYNQWLHRQLNGYIPVMYEYAQGYRDVQYPKLCRTIPLPIDTTKTKYIENRIGEKVIFFHGINRKEKGTDLIVPAMERLQRHYPKEVEIIVEGKMPIDDYLKLLGTVNIVIDQAYSVSYGMNALYAMAKGRIVVGGAEEECLQEFGLTDCPIINITPEVNDIYNKLVMILNRKDEILEWGRWSREFVETHHDAVKIARQYLEVWQQA